MLRADCRESISQAVSGIRDISSLEGRSKAAIAQAVVLRLLAAAGWDVFDLSQVMPGYITGDRSIDFALMSPGRPKGAISPSVFIAVRPPGEDVQQSPDGAATAGPLRAGGGTPGGADQRTALAALHVVARGQPDGKALL